jgi:hypothetical protein
MKRTAPVVFLLCALALSGCFRKPVAQFPAGEQIVTGTVKPAELSLTRRGTHLLVQNGETTAYLESSVVNLRQYENKEVQMRGTYEANTDPTDMPVLVVQEVVGGLASTTRAWTIPALGISLTTPKEWKGKIMGDTAAFTGSGSETPILTVFREGEDKLLASASSSSAAGVRISTFTMGIRHVVRSYNQETGNERVQIDLRPVETDATRDILTLLFTPTDEVQLDPEGWKALTDGIVRSVVFAGDASSSSLSSSASSQTVAPATGSGAGAGSPCGGDAGILCPLGYYCNITDLKANTGVCQKL